MITCFGLSPALDVTYGIPRLEVGGIHRPAWRLALPGGKSLNLARALHLLGGDSRAIAPLGGGIGDEIRRTLEERGMRIECVTTSMPTRICVSVFDASDASITEFYERVPAVDDATWELLVAALDRLRGGRLAVSGSVPETRADELGEALSRAAARGIRLALDLRGPALEAVLAAASVDLVKVNRLEAEELLGPGELVDTVHALRARGVGTVVVTDGGEGSVAADDAGVWRVGAPQAGPYTVGAGDSFFAGLLLGLDTGDGLPSALRSAASVAAANTLQPGAAVFDRDDVAAFEHQVEVAPV